MTDLSRLSIDCDGRLYWDGKPVEVRRRISMSRAQIVGASIVAAFVVIGALASAIQGAVAARELACRFGWSASACTLPGAVQPRHGSTSRPDVFTSVRGDRLKWRSGATASLPWREG